MVEAMICRSAANAKYDVIEQKPGKILTMGPPSEAVPASGGGLGVAEYFLALAEPGYWSDVDRLTLGNSMHRWQPPTVLRALLRAGEIAAGRPLGIAWETGRSAPAQTIERALATWLVATSAGVGEDPDGLEELTYFVTGGGYRGDALKKVLGTLAPGKRFANVADIGAAVGMIPLLLAAEPVVGVRSVCLVEPYDKFLNWGQKLWSLAAALPLAFEFQHCSAEAAVLAGGRDLVFFGQCFYLIGEGRYANVLARVSEALAAGGFLILNEAVRSDPATPDVDWDNRYPSCLSLPRLVEHLSAIGRVGVLRRHSDWRRIEDPHSLSAPDIGLDSFFAVSRR